MQEYIHNTDSSNNMIVKKLILSTKDSLTQKRNEMME